MCFFYSFIDDVFFLRMCVYGKRERRKKNFFFSNNILNLGSTTGSFFGRGVRGEEIEIVRCGGSCSSLPILIWGTRRDFLNNLRAYSKFSFKHVREHVIRILHKCHIFVHKFVKLVGLKVPSGNGVT